MDVQDLRRSGTALGHLRHRQALGHLVVHAGAAVGLWNGQLQDAQLHQARHIFPGETSGLVDLIGQRFDGALGVVPHQLLDRQLILRELEHVNSPLIL